MNSYDGVGPHGRDDAAIALYRARTQGQVTVLMALFITVLLGAAALTVDLGYAYVQQRHMQNLADSASTAGTLALQKNASSVTDAQVKQAMLNNLTAAGMQVQWDSAGASSAPVPNKVTVRAEYIYVDSSTTPHTSYDSGSYVGAASAGPPANAGASVPAMTVGGTSKRPNGVRVDYMSINSPAFFAKVLGRAFFTVQASGAEALQSLTPPNLGGTPTTTAAVTAPLVPFTIWGGNSGGLQAGADYNFWGHSWDAQVNPNSSGYDTTARFKGYIDTLPTGWDPNNPTTSCPAGSTTSTQCWSTSPGNSSHPPSGSPPLAANGCLPQTMDVLVITNATQSGGTDYGNIVAVVEIAVDNPCSYKPDPGHPMNGTIIREVSGPANFVRSAPTPTAGVVQMGGA